MKAQTWNSLLSAVIILSVTFWLAACGESPVSGPDITFPESDVSYSRHVEPFMKKTCAYSGCHGGALPAAGIYLGDYFEMTKYPGMVIPGKPDQSRLIQIIEKESNHFTKFYRGDIDQNSISGMRTWIAEGAKFN